MPVPISNVKDTQKTIDEQDLFDGIVGVGHWLGGLAVTAHH